MAGPGEEPGGRTRRRSADNRNRKLNGSATDHQLERAPRPTNRAPRTCSVQDICSVYGNKMPRRPPPAKGSRCGAVGLAPGRRCFSASARIAKPQQQQWCFEDSSKSAHRSRPLSATVGSINTEKKASFRTAVAPASAGTRRPATAAASLPGSRPRSAWKVPDGETVRVPMDKSPADQADLLFESRQTCAEDFLGSFPFPTMPSRSDSGANAPSCSPRNTETITPAQLHSFKTFRPLLCNIPVLKFDLDERSSKRNPRRRRKQACQSGRPGPKCLPAPPQAFVDNSGPEEPTLGGNRSREDARVEQSPQDWAVSLLNSFRFSRQLDDVKHRITDAKSVLAAAAEHAPIQGQVPALAEKVSQTPKHTPR
jgi:hypothetical protein